MAPVLVANAMHKRLPKEAKQDLCGGRGGREVRLKAKVSNDCQFSNHCWRDPTARSHNIIFILHASGVRSP
nr:hypothetical protein CFP56_10386 [Quercus suber]POF13242.1 hypothetical protein CFP56_10389 [Quercus suber]